MNEIIKKTAYELASLIKKGELTSLEVTKAFLERIHDTNDVYNSFITITDDVAVKQAEEADKVIEEARKNGTVDDLPALAGVPVGIKDMVVTEGIQTTAGSQILKGWIPPYDATIVENCKKSYMPILGKLNQDEFAVGSSNEFSSFGPVLNHWDTSRVPGGSSGGSAVAVGSNQVPLSIGTDTGGSIRQPAALTGTVGMKPTYGSVSRYGVIEMCSSLDQVGPIANSVLDLGMFYDVLSNYDTKDSTSLEKMNTDEFQSATQAAKAGEKCDLNGVKIGYIPALFDKFDVQKEVKENLEKSVEHLKKMGAEFVNVEFPTIKYTLSAYYIIMPSEFSSNLARYDGMRYGQRCAPEGKEPTAENVMAETREKYLGPEVKRRIILGTYALSAGYFDAYYGTAQKIRTLAQRDFKNIFDQVDILLMPTSATTAFKIGEKKLDPMMMYMNDIFTLPANLAGVSGISIPSGVDENNLPTAVQFITAAKDDYRLFYVGNALQKSLEAEWGGSLNEVFHE